MAVNKIDTKSYPSKIELVVKQCLTEVFDQELPIKLILMSYFTNGHILIEDRPGMGKTTLVKAMANSLGQDFGRIQFTADLLPSDIIGANIFKPSEEKFEFVKGPIFHSIILADELNRAPPRTQGALLQAMEERMVTYESEVYSLSENFFVMATQNPFGGHGTYPLPESQLDRFSLKFSMTNLSLNSFKEMLDQKNKTTVKNNLKVTKEIINNAEILEIKNIISEVTTSDKIKEYIYNIYEESKKDANLTPLSIRFVLDLINLSKANAVFEDRNFVIPEDVQFIFPYCSAHRLFANLENSHQVNLDKAKEFLDKIKL